MTSATYQAQLKAWATELGYTVARRRRRCVRMIGRYPNHTCSSRCVQLHESDLCLDHVELLLDGDGRYAVLSQLYAHTDDPRATHMGPAPYGHGTHAYLYSRQPDNEGSGHPKATRPIRHPRPSESQSKDILP